MRRRLSWLWRLTLDVVDEYRKDRIGDLAASITFWTLLSIPAAVLALISALGPFEAVVGADVTDDLRSTVTDFVDETFADSAPLESAVLDLFEADQRRVLTVTTFFALFTLSRGFAGIIRGLDDVYEVEERRRWWHVRLNAIVMGTGTIAVIATTSTFLALLPSRIGPLATVVFVPISLLVLVAWATTLFHWGPNHRTPWRYDLPGAVVTAIGWTVATQLFAVYVRVAGAGNQVQSTVGALLLGITLLYTLAVIMLVGAEVNDVLARRAGVVQAPIGFRERVESAREGFDSARSLVDDLRDRKSD